MYIFFTFTGQIDFFEMKNKFKIVHMEVDTSTDEEYKDRHRVWFFLCF